MTRPPRGSSVLRAGPRPGGKRAIPLTPPPACRPVRVCKWSAEAEPWERVQGKWTVGEGLNELLRAAVSSCRWLGNVEKRG